MLKESEWININHILSDLYTTDSIPSLAKKLMNTFRMLIAYTKGYFIILDDDGQISPEKSCFIGMEKDIINNYVHTFYSKDYLNYIYDITSSTAVYRDTEILNDEMRTRTDFYKKFLKPSGIPFGCGILVIKNGSVVSIFNLFRGEESGDFTEKDVFILDIFKKHIENMVCHLIYAGRQQYAADRFFEKSAAAYCFTQRETEVLRLLRQGFSNNEIAEKLIISTSTVKKHVYNLYDKAGVKSRTKLLNALYEQL